MALVFDNDDDEKVKQFVARFSSSSDGASGPVEMGACPPCEGFAKLNPVASLSQIIEKYHTCRQPKQLRDINAALADAKAPLSQLTAAALKAEKSLKGAKDQLRRQQEKVAAQSAKAKAQEKTSTALPLFDQGVALAQQVQRFSVDNLPETLDFSRPWVLSCPAWVGEASAACKPDFESFKVAFDIGRKENKGMRASKPISAQEMDFKLQDKLADLLKKYPGALRDVTGLPALSKQAAALTLFGIDVGYDKVSTESAGLAVFRLTLEGTRRLVLTEGLQLLGYMQRKGVAGTIGVARQGAFFRNMSASALEEFVGECSLYTTTLQGGDLLYIPFGAVLGEQVQQVSYGWRQVAPVSCQVDKNLTTAVKRRLEQVATAKQASQSQEEQAKLDVELELLREVLKEDLPKA